MCGAQLLRKMIKAEDHIRSSQAQKYPSCSKIPHWFPFAHTVQDSKKKRQETKSKRQKESVSDSDVSKKCNSSLDINTAVMRKTKHSNKKEKLLKIDHVPRFRWYRRRICSSHTSRNSNMVSNERSKQKTTTKNTAKKHKNNTHTQTNKQTNKQPNKQN